MGRRLLGVLVWGFALATGTPCAWAEAAHTIWRFEDSAGPGLADWDYEDFVVRVHSECSPGALSAAFVPLRRSSKREQAMLYRWSGEGEFSAEIWDCTGTPPRDPASLALHDCALRSAAQPADSVLTILADTREAWDAPSEGHEPPARWVYLSLRPNGGNATLQCVGQPMLWMPYADVPSGRPALSASDRFEVVVEGPERGAVRPLAMATHDPAGAIASVPGAAALEGPTAPPRAEALSLPSGHWWARFPGSCRGPACARIAHGPSEDSLVLRGYGSSETVLGVGARAVAPPLLDATHAIILLHDGGVHAIPLPGAPAAERQTWLAVVPPVLDPWETIDGLMMERVGDWLFVSSELPQISVLDLPTGRVSLVRLGAPIRQTRALPERAQRAATWTTELDEVAELRPDGTVHILKTPVRSRSIAGQQAAWLPEVSLSFGNETGLESPPLGVNQSAPGETAEGAAERSEPHGWSPGASSERAEQPPSRAGDALQGASRGQRQAAPGHLRPASIVHAATPLRVNAASVPAEPLAPNPHLFWMGFFVIAFSLFAASYAWLSRLSVGSVSSRQEPLE